MNRKFTQKMSDTFNHFSTSPVVICHHPKYKSTNMSNQVEDIEYSNVKIYWEKLFKLLGLYQKLYEVLTPFKCDPNHYGKKIEYEIKVVKKKSDANPHYYKICISPLGETVINGYDAVYIPSESKSVQVKPLYNSFIKVKKLIISVLKDEYEMTAKDMKDCNYLFKLINKLEKK